MLPLQKLPSISSLAYHLLIRSIRNYFKKRRGDLVSFLEQMGSFSVICTSERVMQKAQFSNFQKALLKKCFWFILLLRAGDLYFFQVMLNFSLKNKIIKYSSSFAERFFFSNLFMRKWKNSKKMLKTFLNNNFFEWCNFFSAPPLLPALLLLLHTLEFLVYFRKINYVNAITSYWRHILIHK